MHPQKIRKRLKIAKEKRKYYPSQLATRVNFTGKGKKPEVADKRVYQIS